MLHTTATSAFRNWPQKHLYDVCVCVYVERKQWCIILFFEFPVEIVFFISSLALEKKRDSNRFRTKFTVNLGLRARVCVCFYAGSWSHSCEWVCIIASPAKTLNAQKWNDVVLFFRSFACFFLSSSSPVCLCCRFSFRLERLYRHFGSHNFPHVFCVLLLLLPLERETLKPECGETRTYVGKCVAVCFCLALQLSLRLTQIGTIAV